MDLEKLMIVSRLDGYLNAVSVAKSTERNLKYSARIHECNSDFDLIDNVLLRFFESHGVNVNISLLYASDNTAHSLESFISPYVRVEKEADSEEFSWAVVEIIRVISDNFLQQRVVGYSIEFDDFHGEGCALPIEQGYVVIQFLKSRKA